MAYIGAEPVPGQNREVDDISSGFNGNATAFTLQVNSVNVSPESANNILINLGGVLQNPGTDYTIAASTITFTTAPAAGLSFFGLILGAGINTATVADGTIGTSKVVDNSITADKLAHTSVTAGSYTTADITVDAQGRITAAASGTISGAEIADNAVTTAKIADSTGASDGVTTAKLATDAVTAAKLASNAVVNASVDASAAIAGTKISPDFGSQNIATTGSATIGTDLIHAGDTDTKISFSTDTISVATNGVTRMTYTGNFIDLPDAGTLRLGNSNDLQISHGSGGASNIVHSNTSQPLNISATGAGNIAFLTNSNERARIDSSGRVLIGTTATTGGSQPLQVVEDGVGGRIVLARNDTTVSAGATLGTIQAYGNDSDGSYQEVGRIDFVADKNHGTNDKAGRIVFSTTADNASSPTERLYIRNDGELRVLGGNINLQQQSNALNTQNGQIGGGNTQQGFNSRITFNTAGAVNHGNITFHTMNGGTDNEIFRINKDQQFLFQATSSGQVGIMMFRNSTSPYPRIMHQGSGSSFANHTLIEFRSTVDGVIGEIKQDGDSTITYATSSDYRLKENIVDLTGGITRLKNLKPRRFNFKKNPSYTKDGFLAHELQEVIPEAVNGTKDEVVTEDSKANMPQLAEEEVGSPVYQTADLARVVPLLTAALQEAIAKIETLEAKVAALEAA